MWGATFRRFCGVFLWSEDTKMLILYAYIVFNKLAYVPWKYKPTKLFQHSKPQKRKPSKNQTHMLCKCTHTVCEFVRIHTVHAYMYAYSSLIKLNSCMDTYVPHSVPIFAEENLQGTCVSINGAWVCNLILLTYVWQLI